MNPILKQSLIAFAAAGLTACSTTTTSRPPVKQNLTHKNVAQQVQGNLAQKRTIQPMLLPSEAGAQQDKQLTLEKIMSDPDWLGRQPENAYWGDDSKSVFYSRKQQGTPLRELWQKAVNQEDNGSLVPLSDMHLHSYQDRVLNSSGDLAAWAFEGNLFVKELANQKVRQLTRDGAGVSQLQFLHDGRLSFQQGRRIYAITLDTGLTEKLVGWRFATQPGANKKPKDYIAEQQQQLIGYIAKQRSDAALRFKRNQQLQQHNPSVAVTDFYFDPKHELVEISLSPNGRWALMATAKQQASRNDNDIMPHYVQENGRIKAVSVRQRVADAKPVSHQLWLLDLKNQHKTRLSYSVLPGFNEDVLAAVKRENARAKNEEYQDNRLPRDIHLMQDWYWSQSPVQWHNNGDQVAVMLEAWDNKDRWIATVDLKQKSLQPQHRLHDDAWVNYKFNSFGWLNKSETLYYLSEQSGYANLYTKTLNGQEQALISGRFEVDDLTLSQDDSTFYFKANINHPGIYEIYKVSLATKAITPLTQLHGMTDYALSPDGASLLLTHSKLTRPPELYLKPLASGAEPVKLTETISQEFLSYNWRAPNIVAVRSSHVDTPIYSRVYLPQNPPKDKDQVEGQIKAHIEKHCKAPCEKRRAVMFNHGAGYLQNSHLGWSGYFREFMFHNLLLQQGYVVMDMDYRASAGYGRDWRTAIYRQMGTPEIQDLADGVNWLVENANVDRDRVGTYGGSYGGFMTFMAIYRARSIPGGGCVAACD